WLFHLGFAFDTVPLPESLDYWRRFASAFRRELLLTPELERLRARAVIPADPDILAAFYENAPLVPGIEHLTTDRLASLWTALNTVFQEAVHQYQGTVEALLHSLRPDVELAGRVFFHLVENNKGPQPFAFLATYSTEVAQDGTTRHLPLKHALQEFAGNNAKLVELLGTVYRAARDSRLLAELLETGRIFQPLAFDTRRALTFLRETPLYETSGIRCRIPNWWTAKSARVGIAIKVGNQEPSVLGLDALVSCLPELRVGDTPISPEEAQRLLAESEGLVLIKNRWVEVDREKLRQTLDAYAQATELLADGMTLREAMRLLLNPDQTLGNEGIDTEVTFGDWLAEVARKLANPALARAVAPVPGFLAVLRPYQQLGLNWLAFLDSLGLGACLADDMGLGKTIQVLAFLSTRRGRVAAPSLLVVPASLLGNWQEEIQRFLPGLNTLVAHASAIGKQARDGIAAETLREHDLVITTYAMIQRADWLRKTTWDYIILDEAQAIKNPGARQTRAAKQLVGHNRLVLTGTPVENRIDDLWSLFDFVNPGLLGTATQFRATAKRLQTDTTGYARLRRVVSPYILRRLKTDRSIIDDLPEKVEMKTYADLSRRQIVLYRQFVDDLRGQLEVADGIQRRGLILASLMKLKQICNHPDHYTGNPVFAEEDSGKFLRLRELCETILAKRERVLVFTQFREMTDPLDRFLASVFGHPGTVLHGGVPVGKRRELVASFQNSRDYLPYMVLSVKAGGTGLNLTRANHVIHFDRWWNPAVENQATDRAFRIGQERGVMVHKFVCQGTVEEKIDQMIAAKADLAETIVAPTGENWITELSNDELASLLTLSIE
ncbi:MAG: DEAD/DEAH box helicase, partial [Lentisphaeria bacterium]|nr:DEAD/DEAH box helicase [Lentisphaeria bacterium]